MTVPAVAGLTEVSAESAILAAGFVVGNVSMQTSSTVPSGSVISQSPGAGADAVKGSAVSLVVASYPPATVPNVVGDTQATAAAALTAAGLVYGNMSQQTSTTVPAGIVISQSIAAGTVEPYGTYLQVVVSLGPPVTMPSLVGDTLAAATAAINAAGLVENPVAQGASVTIPVGSVISQYPAAGVDVTPGSAVNLVISSYPPVTLPNVVGDTQAAATTALTGLGVLIGAVTPVASSTLPAGSVVTQTPAAGTTVTTESAVNFDISSGIVPSESVLHSFTGVPICCAIVGAPDGPDGANPTAGLVLGSDGNFYGTTSAGGMVGAGTVFKVTAAGAETVLHYFTGEGGVSGSADGAVPSGSLIQGSDGYFYGTTNLGGAYGQGTVFKIGASGTESILYSFSGGCASRGETCGVNGNADGANPDAGLAQGIDGNFYGTTFAGGTHGGGTVFRVTPAGLETAIYSFSGGSAGSTDGNGPDGALVQASDGSFYGTTTGGGTHGGGTVFRVTPAGVESVLYSFQTSGTVDGSFPQGTLILASDGNFYGTAAQGGAYGGGAVFRVTLAGLETVIYSFSGAVAGSTDGSGPNGVLFQASDGNFYGMTPSGGAFGQGTIFRVTAAGAETLLYSFSGCYDDINFVATCGTGGSTDGANPVGGLIQDSTGIFYGVTKNGGTNQSGTVFKLTGAIAAQ